MCAVALCPNDKRGELRNEQPWVRVVLCSLAVYLQGLSPTKWVPGGEGGGSGGVLLVASCDRNQEPHQSQSECLNIFGPIADSSLGQKYLLENIPKASPSQACRLVFSEVYLAKTELRSNDITSRYSVLD